MIGISVTFAIAKTREKLNPLTLVPTSAIWVKKHWKCKELFCVFSPNGIRTWDLPISSPTLYHWAIEPTVTLFGKYLRRQYRERTTPSQIFMPCNLSSCGVCIALQASIYSECHDIVLPNGIMANTIANTENWISARSSNVRPAIFSTKAYVHNSVPICLIMTKLLHSTI